jgi:hypothetical protein
MGIGFLTLPVNELWSLSFIQIIAIFGLFTLIFAIIPQFNKY